MGGEIDEYVAGGAWDCALMMRVQSHKERDSTITGTTNVSV